MKITAAVARRAHAPLSIETLDLEEPRADEVLVRVVATGIVTPIRRSATEPIRCLSRLSRAMKGVASFSAQAAP